MRNEVEWGEMPRGMREELSRPGYDAAWFARHERTAQLSVLNAYIRLRELGWWDLIEEEEDSGGGCFQVLCRVEALRARLCLSPRFTTPRGWSYWQSRELCSTESLHIKHFTGWSQNKIQVHIDRFGLEAPRKWLVAPHEASLALWRHLRHYDSYRDVEAARRALHGERDTYAR